eukprot:TRINITY_DN16303_c0_g1_i3.p1 TRINITY_DN16303_c0_g1~~TRINITY_DN16303_c0_g1_i3.p1  ORF type:complete len:564 (+),score=175.91 TRINITY_DN16303_c0_g1_i3:313-2004(+)
MMSPASTTYDMKMELVKLADKVEVQHTFLETQRQAGLANFTSLSSTAIEQHGSVSQLMSAFHAVSALAERLVVELGDVRAELETHVREAAEERYKAEQRQNATDQEHAQLREMVEQQQADALQVAGRLQAELKGVQSEMMVEMQQLRDVHLAELKSVRGELRDANTRVKAEAADTHGKLLIEISRVETAAQNGVEGVKAGLVEHFGEIREMVCKVGESTATALTAEREERESETRQLQAAQEHGVKAAASARVELSEQVAGDLKLVEERAVKAAAHQAQPEYEQLGRGIAEMMDGFRMREAALHADTQRLESRVELAERRDADLGRLLEGIKAELNKLPVVLDQQCSRKDLEEHEVLQATATREAIAEVCREWHHHTEMLAGKIRSVEEGMAAKIHADMHKQSVDLESAVQAAVHAGAQATAATQAVQAHAVQLTNQASEQSSREFVDRLEGATHGLRQQLVHEMQALAQGLAKASEEESRRVVSICNKAAEDRAQQLEQQTQSWVNAMRTHIAKELDTQAEIGRKQWQSCRQALQVLATSITMEPTSTSTQSRSAFANLFPS